MFQIRRATAEDESFWFSLDRHMRPSEYPLKLLEGRAYIIADGERPLGVMRYNLLWDSLPFLTLIFLEENHRGKGYGQKAMLHWEKEMEEAGYGMVMTSTQVDEEAQHFYRKLGYVDRGVLFLDGTPLAQAQELFFVMVLKG